MDLRLLQVGQAAAATPTLSARYAPKSETALCFLSPLPWHEVFFKLLNQCAELLQAGHDGLHTFLARCAAAACSSVVPGGAVWCYGGARGSVVSGGAVWCYGVARGSVVPGGAVWWC